MQYKRGLVQEHEAELSLEHRHRLMYDPARTKGELDAAVERYRAEFRRQQEVDAASARPERTRASEEIERAGPVDPGAGSP